MTDEREVIETTIRHLFATYAYEKGVSAREAYSKCCAFAYGIKIGSQDADLCNFTNALLEKYRLLLIGC